MGERAMAALPPRQIARNLQGHIARNVTVQGIFITMKGAHYAPS